MFRVMRKSIIKIQKCEASETHYYIHKTLHMYGSHILIITYNDLHVISSSRTPKKKISR